MDIITSILISHHDEQLMTSPATVAQAHTPGYQPPGVDSSRVCSTDPAEGTDPRGSREEGTSLPDAAMAPGDAYAQMTPVSATQGTRTRKRNGCLRRSSQPRRKTLILSKSCDGGVGARCATSRIQILAVPSRRRVDGVCTFPSRTPFRVAPATTAAFEEGPFATCVLHVPRRLTIDNRMLSFFLRSFLRMGGRTGQGQGRRGGRGT